MRLALALVLLTACGDKETTFDNIVPGGGGGGTGGMRADAPTGDSGDASTTITGRVCKVTMPPSLDAVSCASSGLAGVFTVTLDTQTVMSADDGSFTLMRPTTPTGQVFLVTGTGFEKSAVQYDATKSTFLLPSIDSTTYGEMISATTSANGNALMARISRSGTAVAGVTVMTTPGPDNAQLFYDGSSVTSWNTDMTHGFGIAWAPSISASSATLVVQGTPNTTFTGIPLYTNTITFVFAEIP